MGVRGKAFSIPALTWRRFAALAMAASSCKEQPRPPSEVETPVPAKARKEDPSPPHSLPQGNSRPGHQLAARVEYRAGAKPPIAATIEVGDGWGCATLQDRSRYCWEAPGRELGVGGPVVAQHVAWLDDTRTAAGPDRICSRELDDARCFRAPDFIRNREELARRRDSRAVSDSASWLVPRRDEQHGPLIDPTTVRHGAWRGCADELCWGPRDALPESASGQLKICHHEALAAPCAVADTASLRKAWDMAMMNPHSMIGDLFGCFRTHRGLLCIGASRDGLFGTREACPSELLSAWPTATGAVPAPKARCSRTPVLLRSGETAGNIESASPRGVCFEELASARGGFEQLANAAGRWSNQYCFGAVWLPELPLVQVAVGLGDEPSACGIDRMGQVYCWGAGYSHRGRPLRPIEFAIPTAPSVAWGVAGPFHPSCNINRNCTRSPKVLAACPAGTSSRTVRAVLKEPKSLAGQTVAVRGELVVANLATSLVGIMCEGGEGNFCCDSAASPIAVRDPTHQLIIEGLKCTGDLSRMCCNASPLGQPVIASGRLTWRRWVEGMGDAWTLAEATLCEVRASGE